jgi:hypothetical protein
VSIEDPPPNPADDEPVDDEPRESPPDRLDAPLEADEADALEQELEVPPLDDDA